LQGVLDKEGNLVYTDEDIENQKVLIAKQRGNLWLRAVLGFRKNTARGRRAAES
jgi:hypothetical protein